MPPLPVFAADFIDGDAGFIISTPAIAPMPFMSAIEARCFSDIFRFDALPTLRYFHRPVDAFRRCFAAMREAQQPRCRHFAIFAFAPAII